MVPVNISINVASDAEAFAIKIALQEIAKNFNKDNIIYIAELSKKPNVNEKFKSLKNNPFIKTML